MQLKTNMDKGISKTTESIKPLSRVKFTITELSKKNLKNST